jgi:hypothetical protein
MLAMKQQSEVDATGGRIGECGTGSSADYRHIFHRFQKRGLILDYKGLAGSILEHYVWSSDGTYRHRSTVRTSFDIDCYFA